MICPVVQNLRIRSHETSELYWKLCFYACCENDIQDSQHFQPFMANYSSLCNTNLMKSAVNTMVPNSRPSSQLVIDNNEINEFYMPWILHTVTHLSR